MTDVLKNNCTSGELSPKLHRRSGIEQYANGLALCENCIVSPYGGVERRRGTRFIAAAKYANRVCIARDFTFSESQAYTLEIGHLYIRFYTDKAQIQHTENTVETYNHGTTYASGEYIYYVGSIFRSKEDGNVGHYPDCSQTYWEKTPILEVSTPFEEQHLRSLRFEQSADVLYIYNSTSCSKLTRLSHTNWSIESSFFTGGPFQSDNNTDVTLSSSATTGSVTVTASGAASTLSSNLAPGSNCIDPDSDTNSITGLTPFTTAIDADYSVLSESGGATGYCLKCESFRPLFIMSNSGLCSDGTYYYTISQSLIYAHTLSGNAFVLAGDLNTGVEPTHIMCQDGYIYIACKSDGLKAYSFDGSTFTLEGSVDDGGSALFVFGDGTYIHLANDSDGLRAYTFDGSTFTNVAHVDDGGSYYCVWWDGDYIYTCGSELRSYSFNGSAFTLEGSLDIPGWGYRLFGDGTYIYESRWASGLYAYTFDGSTFSIAGSVNDGGSAKSVWCDGTYIYLANGYDGMRAYTFNGSTFTTAGSLSGPHESVEVWGDGTYVYFANNGAGVDAYTFDGESFGPADTDIDINVGVQFTISSLTPGTTYDLNGVFKLSDLVGTTTWISGAYFKVDSYQIDFTPTTSWTERTLTFVPSTTSVDVEIGVNVERISGADKRPNVVVLFDNVTVKSGESFFSPKHVGSLWKLTNGLASQNISSTFSGTGVSTNVITASEKVVVEVLKGSWVATLQIQRYFNQETLDWYTYQTITSGGYYELSDSRDIYYRLSCSAHTSGTVAYNIYSLDSNSDGPGVFEVTAVASDGLSCTATIQRELTSTADTMIWAKPEWSMATGYPFCGKIYEGRMMLAGTNSNPTGLWGSAALSFDDMTAGENDGDAVSYTLNAKGGLNTPKWLAAWDKLMIGTAGGEIRLESDGLSPSNPPDKKQDTNSGSANIQAFIASRAVLFVDGSGEALREYVYDDSTKAYDAASLSIIAEHILRDGGGCIDACYQQKQDSIVWCVLEDGTFPGMTYLPVHSVSGWHRHTTDGEVESCCSRPGSGGNDELWMSVKRTIGGVDARYIEVLEDAADDVEDQFYVDSGLNYDGSATTTLTGLDHLEGESVVCLGDGVESGPYTVSGGAITVDTSVSKAVVGLAYEHIVKFLEPDVGNQSGSAYGQPKDVHAATLHFVNTGAGVQVGLDENHMKNIPELSEGSLTTADSRVSLDGGDGTASIIVKSSAPLPMYLASVVYDVAAGGE